MNDPEYQSSRGFVFSLFANKSETDGPADLLYPISELASAIGYTSRKRVGRSLPTPKQKARSVVVIIKKLFFGKTHTVLCPNMECRNNVRQPGN